MKKIILTLGTLLFSTSVFASDFRFAYESSEFSSPESVAAFHERLEDAARDYCNGRYLKNRNLRAKGTCLDDVISIVVDEIGDPYLVADSS